VDRDRHKSDLEEKIRLGNEFGDWYQHECTQLVLEYLQQRAEKAVHELTTIDPNDGQKISAAQNENKMFHELRNIVAAFRTDGQNAVETLHQIEKNIPDY
jgi:hypothetical protein